MNECGALAGKPWQKKSVWWESDGRTDTQTNMTKPYAPENQIWVGSTQSLIHELREPIFCGVKWPQLDAHKPTLFSAEMQTVRSSMCTSLVCLQGLVLGIQKNFLVHLTSLRIKLVSSSSFIGPSFPWSTDTSCVLVFLKFTTPDPSEPWSYTRCARKSYSWKR